MDGYQQYMYNSSSAMEGSCDRRASWYPGPPTYQVNAHAANVAVLPNQAPLYRPSINQCYSNHNGIPFAESRSQDARESTVYMGSGGVELY